MVLLGILWFCWISTNPFSFTFVLSLSFVLSFMFELLELSIEKLSRNCTPFALTLFQLHWQQSPIYVHFLENVSAVETLYSKTQLSYSYSLCSRGKDSYSVLRAWVGGEGERRVSRGGWERGSEGVSVGFCVEWD